jgi:hypothetical protein
VPGSDLFRLRPWARLGGELRYLRHLFFDGEFMSRARLLSGLTLEQVGHRAKGASHSIYEEVWHLVAWQRIVVERGLPILVRSVEN